MCLSRPKPETQVNANAADIYRMWQFARIFAKKLQGSDGSKIVHAIRVVGDCAGV